MMANTNFLRIPMQMLLFDVRDVEAFEGLPADNADLLWTEYDDAEVRNLVAALEFAEANPAFDFRSLMPELAQSNGEIHLFLCKVLASLRAAIARRADRPGLSARGAQAPTAPSAPSHD